MVARLRLHRRRIALLGLLGLALVLPYIPPFTGEDYRRWLIVAAFMAAQAVAFDFTAGYINIVNFGFAAFVGVGAYISGLLAVNLGLSPWIGAFIGGAASGFAGGAGEIAPSTASCWEPVGGL